MVIPYNSEFKDKRFKSSQVLTKMLMISKMNQIIQMDIVQSDIDDEDIDKAFEDYRRTNHLTDFRVKVSSLSFLHVFSWIIYVKIYYTFVCFFQN